MHLSQTNKNIENNTDSLVILYLFFSRRTRNTHCRGLLRSANEEQSSAATAAAGAGGWG